VPVERVDVRVDLIAGDVSTAEGSIEDLPSPLAIPRGATRPSKVLARLRAHER